MNYVHLCPSMSIIFKIGSLEIANMDDRFTEFDHPGGTCIWRFAKADSENSSRHSRFDRWSMMFNDA